MKKYCFYLTFMCNSSECEYPEAMEVCALSDNKELSYLEVEDCRQSCEEKYNEKYHVASSATILVNSLRVIDDGVEDQD